MASLSVRVTPRSSRSRVVLEGGLVRVWVTAPPADGEANLAVCEVLAKALAVPKTSVSIERGHTSRDKVVSVPLSLEEVEARLGQSRLL